MSDELIRAAPRKSLGQHFLFDRDLLRRIALCLGPIDGRTVLEVGPGPGGLTRALLEAGAARVLAIELDTRFAEGLSSWPDSGSRLHVVLADALEADEPALITQAGGAEPALIIANLPYQVATPLIIKWLKAGPWRGPMAVMVQKEVGQRLCAAPDTEHYGRLAVIAQAVTSPRIAMIVPPGAFKPPPKVDSAVVAFTPLQPEACFPDLDAIETVTAAAFGQRRKMLRSALKRLALDAGTDAETLLSAAGIDPTRRAETLTQDDFRRLAAAWRNSRL